MSTDPSISVVVPAYNEAEYIEDCLQSVDDQRVGVAFEIVVCDDCSTDITADILDRKTERIDRLRMITNKENKGLISSCNRLLEEAKGKYFVKIDADSTMKPGTLAAIHSKVADGYPLVFGRVDVKNTSYLHPAAAQIGKLRERSTWYGGACIAGHRDQFVDSGGFDQQMIAAEDQELKQRAKALNWSVAYLDQAGVKSNFPKHFKPVLYRKYDSAKSHLRQYKNMPEEFNIWELRGPIFWSVFIFSLLCSLLFPLSSLFSVLLLGIPLSQYARDAELAVEISGRQIFYVFYPLYEIGGGLARTVGIWTEIDIVVNIISDKYLPTG